MSKLSNIGSFAVGLCVGVGVVGYAVNKKINAVKNELNCEKERAIIDSVNEFVKSTMTDVHTLVTGTKKNIDDLVATVKNVKNEEAISDDSEAEGGFSWSDLDKEIGLDKPCEDVQEEDRPYDSKDSTSENKKECNGFGEDCDPCEGCANCELGGYDVNYLNKLNDEEN